MTFTSGASSDNYKRFDLGNFAHILIFNDSVANQLSFSIDGVTEIGFLFNGGIEFRDANIQTIYVKSRVAGASCNYRIWGFGVRNVVYPQQQNNNTNNSPDVPKDLKPFSFGNNFLKVD